MAMMMEKSGEATKSMLCIVTGASRGLGRSISREVCREWGLARNFARIDLALVARDTPGLEETAEECRKIHASVRTHVLTIDLSVHEDMKRLNEQLTQLVTKQEGQYREVALFANAGSLGDVSKPISTRSDPGPLQQYFDLMLTSNIVLASWFVSDLKCEKKLIVYISSLMAVQPVAGLSLYSAGKAGAHMMFRSLAAENPGVRVLVYSPGPLQTAMTDENLNNMPFEPTRRMFSEMKLFPPDDSVRQLFRLIQEDKYSSGDYFDIYDIIKD